MPAGHSARERGEAGRSRTAQRKSASRESSAAAGFAGVHTAADAIGHSPAQLAQRERLASAFGSAFTGTAQLAMSTAAQGFIDAAFVSDAVLAARMTAVGLAANYAAGEARLTATEKSTLEALWTQHGSAGNTKNRQRLLAKRTTAGEIVAAQLVDMLEILNPVSVYGNNFDTKHTGAGAVDSSTAIANGNARSVKPLFNTAFRQSYIEGKVALDAAAKGDGAQRYNGAAADAAGGDMALAKWHVPHQTYKASPLGIFQYVVVYTITTNHAARTRTISINHLETAWEA